LKGKGKKDKQDKQVSRKGTPRTKGAEDKKNAENRKKDIRRRQILIKKIL